MDLFQTVFLLSTNTAFKRLNTHTYKHTHTPTHTHAHTPTRIHSDECNRREWNALFFTYKSGYRLTPRLHSWHPLTSSRLVSSYRSVSAAAVPIANILYKTILYSIFAYRTESSSVLCTCQCIRLEYLTLKMKVKNVEDSDENWHGTLSTCISVQKLLLVGSVVCSWYMIVHFVAGRTHERTSILPAGIHRSNAVRTV